MYKLGPLKSVCKQPVCILFQFLFSSPPREALLPGVGQAEATCEGAPQIRLQAAGLRGTPSHVLNRYKLSHIL